MATAKLLKKQLDLSKLMLKAAVDFAAEEQAPAKFVVQANLDDLEKSWRTFRENHGALVESNLEEGDPYYKDDVYSKTRKGYTTFKGTLLELLDNHAASVHSCPSQADSNFIPNTRGLPKMRLPTFSGQYKEWTSFQDHFDSLVGTNVAITPIEKFHYLKGCLTGEAAKMLSNIPVTASNFTPAWENLRSRYENKRALVTAHVEALHSLKQVSRRNARELDNLRSSANNAIEVLRTLGGDPEHWDFFLVHLVRKKIDAETLEAWEVSLGDTTDPPTYKALDSFIAARVRTYESLELQEPSAVTRKPRPPANQTKQHQHDHRGAHVHVANQSSQATSAALPAPLKCFLCQELHLLHNCPTYKRMTPQQRHQMLLERNRCTNCFSLRHPLQSCPSAKRCHLCKGLHHSTIHEYVATVNNSSSSSLSNNIQASVPATPVTEAPKARSCLAVNTATTSPQPQILLATAVVRVIAPQGDEFEARALLDQGSELSFVCEALVQALHLKRRSSSIPLVGIGAKQSLFTRGVVRFIIQPRFHSSERYEVEAHILPQITKRIPSEPAPHHEWRHLNHLTLADPTFSIPGNIDILLGANAYGYLLRDDVVRGQDKEPVAQNTMLGWIVSGLTSATSQPKQPFKVISQCAAEQHLHYVVQEFWKQEVVSPPEGGHVSEDDRDCENHYQKTHSRDSTGRYIVRLPFKSKPKSIGDSRFAAAQLLRSLQQRLKRDPKLCSLYVDFLDEYRKLGHMKQVTIQDSDVEESFYLPHHGVLRESSSTTKLRVVFNGSQKTKEGLSLNDVLHAGPKVQQDLESVLLRWRVFTYVFSSDIEKMYRQIRIHPEDMRYQQILWNADPNQIPSTFQLTTVTYGLTCAPFLAIRTLLQLAEDEEKRFPLGADIIRKNMYVDDCLSGGDTVEIAQERALQVQKLLMAGGFHLQKWASNDSAVLSRIADEPKLQTNKEFGEELCLRALGLSWNPSRDSFVFAFSADSITTTSNCDEKETFTKRSVLSVIARLFDPLGWLSPVDVLAKVFLQSLWTTNLGWDTPLPPKLAGQWKTILQEFRAGVTFSIPRWLGTLQSSVIELHGFSDASRAALSAVVYIRVLEEDLTARVTLLTSKTKVAPLKPVTIPRLELSAATLLAQLVVRVRQTLELSSVPVHLWVDSSVALTWIRGHPSRWKESNRVALIQEVLPGCRWNHVAGSENPADIASRGLFPSELEKAQSWWHGPEWLKRPSTSWPSNAPGIPDDVNLEERGKAVLTAASSSALWNMIERYSSIERLLRITARVAQAASRFHRRVPGESCCVPLKPSQLNDALVFWIKQT